jgi:quinoprotein glucose dehydrogenase
MIFLQRLSVTVKRNGRTVDAVAQVSKMGLVFVFDRATGKSLFDIEERPIPASDVPGEVLSKTQPIPVKPPPISGRRLLEEDLTNITPAKRAYILERYREFGQRHPYAAKPAGYLIYPFNGGANWAPLSIRDQSTLHQPNENINMMTLIAPAGSGFRSTPRGTLLLDDGVSRMNRPGADDCD